MKLHATTAIYAEIALFLGGFKDKCGYGNISFNNRKTLVHRLCWEREVGPIPPGMVIDHMCRNRAYCNVDHLRLVTQSVNATENRISKKLRKEFCNRGHKYSEENTRINSKTGNRYCIECQRIASKKYRMALTRKAI